MFSGHKEIKLRIKNKKESQESLKYLETKQHYFKNSPCVKEKNSQEN